MRTRTGRLDPIAYTYEAAHHCPECAARRFGVSEDGWIPEDATDSEGNSIGALAPWDEWQTFDGEDETLACDTCGRIIDTYPGEPDGRCGMLHSRGMDTAQTEWEYLGNWYGFEYWRAPDAGEVFRRRPCAENYFCPDATGTPSALRWEGSFEWFTRAVASRLAV